MTETDWLGPYRRWNLIFLSMVVGSPIIILVLFLILYFLLPWSNIYYIIPLMIPMEIAVGVLVFLPKVRDSKRLLMKGFGKIQVELAKTKVEDALKEMKSQYQESKKEIKTGPSAISHEYVLSVTGKEIEIRIRKSPVNNQTYVSVKYTKDSDKDYSLQLCERIENRMAGWKEPRLDA
jgi:hypothetical protein